MQEAPVVWAGHDENLWVQETSGLQEEQASEPQSWGWTQWGPGCGEFVPIRIGGTPQASKQAVRHGDET